MVARDGTRQIAGSWLVSPSGWRDGVTLDGSALVPLDQVAAVVVENEAGREFATARHRPAPARTEIRATPATADLLRAVELLQAVEVRGAEARVDALDLARWQFGITTIYHFLFVPLTIGLSVVVASLQTAWHRTGRPEYLRATKFFGKLFLINFAMGVVTGIVQEFQFGMNWSTYSTFVGDVFGAPLALEALLAFFLESTFIGLWIFGWDRLPRRVHLATIWAAAIGSNLSAFFILAANAWMRHPVGFAVDPATGRAHLTDIGAVLTNPQAISTYLHVVSASFVVAGLFVVAVSAYKLLHRDHARHPSEPRHVPPDAARRAGHDGARRARS